MIDENFTGRLLSGERIAWAGRPGGGMLFTGQDVFLIPFSLVWCGIVISIFSTAFASGRVFGPPMLVLVLFVGVGLYFVAGRFLIDIWVRRGLRYAVTDRRMLIERGGPSAASHRSGRINCRI